MPEGATVAVYSDGLLEARIDGKPLGSERLTAWLAELGPEATAAELLDLVVQRADGVPTTSRPSCCMPLRARPRRRRGSSSSSSTCSTREGPDLDGFLEASGVAAADRAHHRPPRQRAARDHRRRDRRGPHGRAAEGQRRSDRRRDGQRDARRARAFTTAVDRPERPLRAVADGHAAPRQPAHGAAGVAVRALAGRALPHARSTTSTAAACARASPSSSSPTSPRSAWTGTDRSCASPSAWTLYAAAIARLDADGLLYPCYCTRAEIREAASAPHGALPEGAYPGTCRELTRRERAAARARRAPARAAPAGRRSRRRRSPIACSERSQASSTIWSFAATTASRHTISPWSSTTQLQGVGEVVRGADLSTPRRASCTSPRCSGLPAPALRPRAARARPRRRPPGQAPRRRDARRSRRRGRVARRGALAARRAPSASPQPGELPSLDELLERFDPSALPTRADGADRMIGDLALRRDRHRRDPLVIVGHRAVNPSISGRRLSRSSSSSARARSGCSRLYLAEVNRQRDE